MLLFSWRMFQTTADPKYLDNIETELYNGILSGISLDGRDFFYTEALRRTKEFPYTMRWPKHRQRYISCFCCPPNTLRTLCQAQEYAYSINKDTLWVNLYGQNTLKTKDIEIEQQTDYPWDGHITLTIKKAKRLQTVVLHIPSWADTNTVRVNGNLQSVADGSPVSITRLWKKGDVIELDLPMRPRLIEANPLVEEAKNQVAVMRGPLVYCLEGQDISPLASGSPADKPRINDIAIPADIQFREIPVTISGHRMTALEGDAVLTNAKPWDNQTLYRELSRPKSKKVRIRLIPYYAWDNRGIDDMSLWLPLAR
jgi:hypothetical protein